MPNPIATYIASLILPQDAMIIETQIRNYLPIFLLSIVCYLVVFIFILMVLGPVKEVYSQNDNILKRASLRTSLQPLSQEYLTIKNRFEPTLAYINNSFEQDAEDKSEFKANRGLKLSFDESTGNRDDNNNNANYLANDLRVQNPRSVSFPQSLPVLHEKNHTFGELFRSLFQIKNATAMIESVFKRREDKSHRLIWCIIVIYVLTQICSNGIPLIMLPFAQKVYGMPTELFMVSSCCFLIRYYIDN